MTADRKSGETESRRFVYPDDIEALNDAQPGTRYGEGEPDPGLMRCAARPRQGAGTQRG